MATLSITVTAGELNRFQVAVGRRRNLGRDATPAEVKQFIIDECKAFVLREERQQAEASITDTVFEPT